MEGSDIRPCHSNNDIPILGSSSGADSGHLAGPVWVVAADGCELEPLGALSAAGLSRRAERSTCLSARSRSGPMGARRFPGLAGEGY
jgi:hypothetical protein